MNYKRAHEANKLEDKIKLFAEEFSHSSKTKDKEALCQLSFCAHFHLVRIFNGTFVDVDFEQYALCLSLEKGLNVMTN